MAAPRGGGFLDRLDSPEGAKVNNSVLDGPHGGRQPAAKKGETFLMKLGRDETEAHTIHTIFGSKFEKAQEQVAQYVKSTFENLAKQLKAAHDDDLVKVHEEHRQLTMRLFLLAGAAAGAADVASVAMQQSSAPSKGPQQDHSKSMPQENSQAMAHTWPKEKLVNAPSNDASQKAQKPPKLNRAPSSENMQKGQKLPRAASNENLQKPQRLPQKDSKENQQKPQGLSRTLSKENPQRPQKLPRQPSGELLLTRAPSSETLQDRQNLSLLRSQDALRQYVPGQLTRSRSQDALPKQAGSRKLAARVSGEPIDGSLMSQQASSRHSPPPSPKEPRPPSGSPICGIGATRQRAAEGAVPPPKLPGALPPPEAIDHLFAEDGASEVLGASGRSGEPAAFFTVLPSAPGANLGEPPALPPLRCGDPTAAAGNGEDGAADSRLPVLPALPLFADDMAAVASAPTAAWAADNRPISASSSRSSAACDHSHRGADFSAADLGAESFAISAMIEQNSQAHEGQEEEDHVFMFELRPLWRQIKDKPTAKMGGERTCMPGYIGMEHLTLDEDAEDEVSVIVRRGSGLYAQLILDPNSVLRNMWELSSLILVLYDIIFIPLALLDPPASQFFDILEWATRLFWSFDMPASLLTGFTKSDGFIEMRPWPIAKRYFRTWFPLDVVVVGVDWVEMLWSAAASQQQGRPGYERIGRAARAFRIIRMVRLLRLLRLKDIIVMMFEYARSESIKEMADMIKMIFIMMAFAHLVACLWYGLGYENPGKYENSWVLEFLPAEQGLGLADRYTYSLRWSLAQFTGGMDELRPVNLIEGVFAASVFVVAFMMGAVLLSSLTSSMTQLRILSNKKSVKLMLLRRYLNDNAIPSRLALRVTRNAQHAMMEQQRYVPEGNVELLEIVSDPLRIELHFAMYAKVLEHHPFFLSYIYLCPHIMRKVCHSATSMAVVSPGDIVFNVGEIPLKPKMIMLVSGSCQYVPMVGTGMHGRESKGGNALSALRAGHWISEAVLWTEWMHRGLLTATSDCRLCLLDAQRFGETVGSFDSEEFDTKVYAAEFVRHLNSGEEVSDVPGRRLEDQAMAAVEKTMASSRVRARRFQRSTNSNATKGFP